MPTNNYITKLLKTEYINVEDITTSDTEVHIFF